MKKTDLEKRLAAYVNAHKQGNTICVPGIELSEDEAYILNLINQSATLNYFNVNPPLVRLNREDFLKVTEEPKSAFENYVDHLMIMHKAGQMIGPIGDADENIIDLIKVFNMATNLKIAQETLKSTSNCPHDNPMHKHKEEPVIHQPRILYVKEKSLPEFFKSNIASYSDGRDRSYQDKIHKGYDILRRDEIHIPKQDLADENGSYYDQVVFELTDRADACAIPLQVNKVYNVEVYDDLSFSLKLSDVKIVLSGDKIQDCCK